MRIRSLEDIHKLKIPTINILKSPYWTYIKTFKWSFFGCLVCIMFCNVLDVLQPYLIGKIFNSLESLSGFPTPYILALLVVSINTAIFRYLWRIIYRHFNFGAATHLRQLTMKNLVNHYEDYHQKKITGDKIALLSQDVQNFRMGIGPGLLILADAFLYLLLIPFFLFKINMGWSIKTLIFLPLLPFFVNRLESITYKIYSKSQKEFAAMTGLAQEIVSGIRVIKSFTLEPIKTLVFSHVSKKYKQHSDEIALCQAGFRPLLEVILFLCLSVFLYIASPLKQEDVKIGDFVAFAQYLQRMIWPMTALGFGTMMVKESKTSFERIKEPIEHPKWFNKDGAESVNSIETINLNNLNFAYPESKENQLKNINLNFELGKSYCIVGQVGSGKTTLMKSLIKQIPINNNGLRFNDVDSQQLSNLSLTNQISYIEQDIFLFNKSIYDNITYASEGEYSIEEIDQSLKNAYLYEEVLDKIKNNEKIGEKGAKLSGGQRQRLALARELLYNKKWNLFDDAFSAVDSKTEEGLLSLIENTSKKETKSFIFTSHRPQNLTWVDEFIVLKEGEVLARGKHKELINTCSDYQNLYEKSVSKKIDKDSKHEG